MQHNFPKMMGGVKGRFVFFQKFIRFGSTTLPCVRTQPLNVLLITNFIEIWFQSQVLTQAGVIGSANSLATTQTTWN